MHIDNVLVSWADEIVVMNEKQGDNIKEKFNPNCPIINLNISDSYEYRNPELIKLIKDTYGGLCE